MASFYGNIKNNSRSSFIFDKIYSSRFAMEKALKEDTDINGEIQGDGVFINRYVLINYGYTKEGTFVAIPNNLVQARNETTNINAIVTPNNYTQFYYLDETTYKNIDDTHYQTRQWFNNNHYYQKVNFVDRWAAGTNIENSYYGSNRQKDHDKYHADYDMTVWMKIYSNNEEKYIMVARLTMDAPALELVIDAPNNNNGGAHFDLLESTDTNYVYHIPNNWQIVLNEYKLNTEYTTSTNIDGYWYYEYDLEDANQRTYETEHEYPYYNKEGFDYVTKHRVSYIDNIGFKDTKSGKVYLGHTYEPIDLTPDTYRRNTYYIKDNNNNYYISIGDFVSEATYYIRTQARSDKYEKISLTPDTYRRNYYYVERNSQKVLAVDPYDENEQYYSNIAEFPQLDTKRLDISLPSIGNAVSDLYDVLYGDNGNNQNRPYTVEQLFNTSDISPYNNLDSSDKICMGWAMEEFKNYISELRYLSHGSTNIDATHPGIGLQSDWTLDLDTGFGYIYHKPKVAWRKNENITPENNPNYESYLQHDIEYIYDNYNNIDSNDLFSSAGKKQIKGVKLSTSSYTTNYLTEIERKDLFDNNIYYPMFLPVTDLDNNMNLGYADFNNNYFNSENNLNKYDIYVRDDNLNNYYTRYISDNDYDLISAQLTTEYPNILPIYQNMTNLLGYTTIANGESLPAASELKDYNILNYTTSFTYKYLTDNQYNNLVSIGTSYPDIYKITNSDNSIVRYTSEDKIVDYSDANMIYAKIALPGNAKITKYLTYNQYEFQDIDFMSNEKGYPWIIEVENEEETNILGYIQEKSIDDLPNRDELTNLNIIEETSIEYEKYLTAEQMTTITNQQTANIWPYIQKVYDIENNNFIGYIDYSIVNFLPEEENLKNFILVVKTNDMATKVITPAQRDAISYYIGRGAYPYYYPVYQNDGTTLIGYWNTDDFPSGENSNLTPVFVYRINENPLVEKYITNTQLYRITAHSDNTDWPYVIPVYQSDEETIIGYTQTDELEEFLDEAEDMHTHLVKLGNLTSKSTYLLTSEEYNNNNILLQTKPNDYNLIFDQNMEFVGYMIDSTVSTLDKIIVKIPTMNIISFTSTYDEINNIPNAIISTDPLFDDGNVLYEVQEKTTLFRAIINSNIIFDDFNNKVKIKGINIINRKKATNDWLTRLANNNTFDIYKVFNQSTNSFIGYADENDLDNLYDYAVKIKTLNFAYKKYLTSSQIDEITSNINETLSFPYAVYNNTTNDFIGYTNETLMNDYYSYKMKLYGINIITRKLKNNQIPTVSDTGDYLVFDSNQIFKGYTTMNNINDYYHYEIQSTNFIIYQKFLSSSQILSLSDDSSLPVIIKQDNSTLKFTTIENLNNFYDYKTKIPNYEIIIKYITNNEQSALINNSTNTNKIPVYSTNNILLGYTSESTFDAYSITP